MTAGPFAPAERPGELQAKAELFMKSMAYMGYAAMNVGVLDLPVGVDRLRALSAKHKIPLVSANLFAKAGGTLAFAPTLVQQVGPLKIGFFGLLSPESPNAAKLLEPDGLEIRPFLPEAQKAVADLEAQGCDLVVLLSQLHRQENEQVLNQVPGVHLALGSLGQDMTMQLSPMARGFFADVHQKGKFLGEITVHLRGDKSRFHMAGRRAALEEERQRLAGQIMSTRSQLELSSRNGLGLTPEARKNLEAQLAGMRAEQKKLVQELEGNLGLKPDASTLELAMVALDQKLPDDPTVDAWVKKFQKKFPKPKDGHRH